MTRSSAPENELRSERVQRRVIALLLLLMFGIPAGMWAPNLIAITTREDDPFSRHDIDSDTTRVVLDDEPLRYPQRFSPTFEPPQTHIWKLAKLLYSEPPPEPPEYLAPLPLGGSYTQPPTVPEPGTGVLLGAGLIALGLRRRSVRRVRRFPSKRLLRASSRGGSRQRA